jgi:hypothetical protein
MLRGNCLGAETTEYHLLFAATRAAEYPLQVDDCSITEARHLYRNRGIKMVLSAISVETGSCRSEPLEALGAALVIQNMYKALATLDSMPGGPSVAPGSAF